MKLLFLLFASVNAVDLTKDTWDDKTAGKAVFVEYLPEAHALHVVMRLASSPNFPGGQIPQIPFALGAYLPLGHPH